MTDCDHPTESEAAPQSSPLIDLPELQRLNSLPKRWGARPLLASPSVIRHLHGARQPWCLMSRREGGWAAGGRYYPSLDSLMREWDIRLTSLTRDEFSDYLAVENMPSWGDFVERRANVPDLPVLIKLPLRAIKNEDVTRIVELCVHDEAGNRAYAEFHVYTRGAGELVGVEVLLDGIGCAARVGIPLQRARTRPGTGESRNSIEPGLTGSP